MRDASAAQLSRAHRAEVVRALFEEHDDDLRRYLRRNIRDGEDAADIAQDVYLRLARYDGLEHVDYARALLFRTAANLLRDHARRRKSRHKDRHCPLESLALAAATPSPEELIDSRQIVSSLIDMIATIDGRRRHAFLLHRLEGLTHREVATAIGVSVSTARRYIDTVHSFCMSLPGAMP